MKFAAAALVFASAGFGHDVISTRLTWTREVSRIVYKNCVSCHHDGGKAFSLVRYEEARPWAKAIKEEVLSRRMPPWNAVKGFGDFSNDRGLTQEQITIIGDWVEGGAPEGDPAYLPKSPRLVSEGSRPAAGTRIAIAGTRKLAADTVLAGIAAGDLAQGSALQVVARRPDGSVEPLLWVQKFNPTFNQPYWFRTPLRLPAGSVIETFPPGGRVSVFTTGIAPKRRTVPSASLRSRASRRNKVDGMNPDGTARRAFLQQVAVAGAAAQTSSPTPVEQPPPPVTPAGPKAPDVGYPRVFRGRNLARIAFPLGGVAAGSLSLGGRGQLRDWEIFNRPNKGYSPAYAFPAIWAQSGKAKPVAKVLESRHLPPYEGQTGLGSNNAPGLTRLDSAVFTGEYPLAHIDFKDRSLPVRVALDAFSPFIPHDEADSGLPVAILRYRVTNPASVPARVSIAFSIDNPVTAGSAADKRVNEYRKGEGLEGLVMSNPGLAETDPMRGSLGLAADPAGGRITYLRGWQKSRWWNAPMLFWDDFSADGELGPEPAEKNGVGSLCLSREIAPGATAAFTFFISWHFPNRTPDWCGWRAPKGEGAAIIGNYYATKFKGAWEAAEYAALNLERLEKRTRLFAAAMRESTLPAAVKDAASANLSTLASTTCFRTSDGEFHGFEGVNDRSGCCFGSCTHVWNYETATPHLFPAFARSLRRAAFGFALDEQGAIRFRQLLPDGKERSAVSAADGQMGQIVHAYYDWMLSGDTEWLRGLWPRLKKAIEFAWVPGGWDADRDGVLEGVQHNTYDVEFFGPNPMCGIYYLAALRAGERMARAVGDDRSAAEYRRLFENGSKWIDANLFNGEFYVQKIRGVKKDAIAASLLSDMGSVGTEDPEYQVGEGCLVDQLVGQYLAEVAGLGALVDPAKTRKTLESIYRYNYKRTLEEHNSVQRIFALNDEAALVICDYGKAERPRIPFPYYAEVMTGFEYSTAAHMLYAGMVRQGVECIRNIRLRYDGEKRNPWDEAECGHHYARAMAAWSGLLALSGFRYEGPRQAVIVAPRDPAPVFQCFWSSATAWGTFRLSRTERGSRLTVKVLSGNLVCRHCEFPSKGGKTSVRLDTRALPHQAASQAGRLTLELAESVTLEEGGELLVDVRI